MNESSSAVIVVFVTRRTSGVARRMDSLIAQLQTRERQRIRIRRLDADIDVATMRQMGVSEIPAIVILKQRKVVGRLVGRATMREIERLVGPHLDSLSEV